MNQDSASFGYSDLQSIHSNEDAEIDFNELMAVKNERDSLFMQECEEINQEIFKTKEEIQSLMILTSAYCTNAGTKTESVILPTVSPRHKKPLSYLDISEKKSNNSAQLSPKPSIEEFNKTKSIRDNE